MVIYFHYHLKCRHIHDKKGAIEVDLLKSSRMNFYHCYYLKLHQINMNRQDLYLMVLYFHYHLKLHIHEFKDCRSWQKRCYLIFWNQVGWIFVIATIWNCIKLIWNMLHEFKKMVLYFHYHLKCRHIHDKKGAIEVDLLKSSRKNFYHC